MSQVFSSWLICLNENGFDQLVPMFSGFLLKHREVKELRKNVISYLPPITSKVTEFETIVNCMEYVQKLSEESNMKYVSITLDVGAAMNAYKTIWNYPDKFKNVVIHLGDFHFIKENFEVT